jgi:hypothetical protein
MATTSEEMYASQEKPVPEVLEDSSAESLPDDRGDDAQVDDYSLSGAKLHIIIF